MKSIIVFCLSLLVFYACNNGTKEEKKDTKEVADITQHPDYQKGLALIAKPENKCLTCHSIEKAIQGPSYRDVANRYAGRPDTIVPHLANKIIHGGNGQWGEIFMTPNNVTMEDAEAMVKYILLMKK